MVTIGNFLFRRRNALFPVAFLLVFLPGPWLFSEQIVATVAGVVIAMAGQFVRVVTIGLKYIVRGGRDRRVYAQDLVVEGIYAHCRNPMYMGNLLLLVGVAVASNSWTCVILALPLFGFVYVAIWAREHTPVFGSQRSAEDWSDDLRKASVWAHYVTVVATPGGDDSADWAISKAKGMLVYAAAVSATSGLTRQLKRATDRERPNALAEESFPSGHSSSSAVHTRLASENLQSVELSRRTRRMLDVGLTAMTIGTSWARIEAGWHFPSDTLFSMALGNFIASFVNDAFLGLEDSNRALALAPTPEGAVVQWTWKF